MSTIEASSKKGIDYQARAAKRAQWEDLDFSLGAPGHVKVRNLSYGEEEANDHTYLVAVENGETEYCTCPADEYQPGECKHRQAVESNEPVMLAANADEAAVKAARGMD